MSKIYTQILVKDILRKNKIQSIKRNILKPKTIDKQNIKKTSWQQTKEERVQPISWIDKK
tara:strand:- start:9797 stop:9976 length:180 start_codon:yes stop_codon:yes gene_type:complete